MIPDEFNEFEMKVYVGEVLNQVEAATLAIGDFNAATGSRGSVARAFAAVQALLGAAAMLSKLLWPNPASLTVEGKPLDEDQEKDRRRTIARGRALRIALGMKGPSALDNRTVRNGF